MAEELHGPTQNPCPHRILDDCGSAFAMGCIGGSLWHFVKGMRMSPRGDGWTGGFNAMTLRAPALGGAFAVWGGLFATYDCTFIHLRHKEDAWNAVMAGASTGATLAIRTGLKGMMLNGFIGGMFLAIIEGVGMAVNKMGDWDPVAHVPDLTLPSQMTKPSEMLAFMNNPPVTAGSQEDATNPSATTTTNDTTTTTTTNSNTSSSQVGADSSSSSSVDKNTSSSSSSVGVGVSGGESDSTSGSSGGGGGFFSFFSGGGAKEAASSSSSSVSVGGGGGEISNGISNSNSGSDMSVNPYQSQNQSSEASEFRNYNDNNNDNFANDDDMKFEFEASFSDSEESFSKA